MTTSEKITARIRDRIDAELGEESWTGLSITTDTEAGAPAVVVTLADQTWTAQQRAIDAMTRVRAELIDEVAISYSFAPTAPRDYDAAQHYLDTLRSMYPDEKMSRIVEKLQREHDARLAGDGTQA